MMRIRFIWSLI